MIYLNGEKITPTIFSDNTSQVWKLPLSEMIKNKTDPILIKWDFEGDQEIFYLVQLCMLLDNEYLIKGYPTPILITDYLPYARQDKHTSNETTFALQAFAKIINSLEFKEVHTIDAHSYCSQVLIERLVNIIPNDEPIFFFDHSGSTVWGFPDQGARDRYSGIEGITSIVLGQKVRDPETGYIKEYKLISSKDLRGEKVFMIDDICDGGMTFIMMAKDLYKAGASEVNLYVTHGIFSKGLDCLKYAGIINLYDKNGIVYSNSHKESSNEK